MGITNLNTHSASYVTVAELAEYWDVTRQLVYKHIQSGLLPAMRLGPRCFRVRTTDAVDFEKLLSSKSAQNGGPNGGSNGGSHGGPRSSSVLLIRQRNRESTSA
jgi:excisionase family DNA binding protein